MRARHASVPVVIACVLVAVPAASARPLATADLAVAQSASAASGVVGNSLTYTITVTNSGPDPATGVVVRDRLAGAKATIASANPSKGEPCSLGTTSRTLRCVVGPLAAGESTQVTAVVNLVGPGTLTVTADVSGRTPDPTSADETSVITTNVVETTPPTQLALAGTAFAAPFTPRPAFTVSWRASDQGGSGIGGYDVRYHSAPPGGGFGTAVAWRTHTADTHAQFAGRPGWTYCFSFRAEDKDGNVSTWTAQRCASILLAAAAARRTGAWQASNGSARSRARGATLTVPAVLARALYVDAVRCPGCGSLDVLWQGRLLRTLDLDAKTRGRALVRVALLPSFGRGSLSVRVATEKKTVTVAAFGIAKR